MQVRHHISPIDFKIALQSVIAPKLWKKMLLPIRTSPTLDIWKPTFTLWLLNQSDHLLFLTQETKRKPFLKFCHVVFFLIYNLIILHVQHFGQQPLLYVLHKYISTFSTQAVIKSSFILLSFCYFKVRGVKILFLSLMLYTLLSLPVTLCLQFTFLWVLLHFTPTVSLPYLPAPSVS